MILGVAAVFSSCGTPKSTSSGSIASGRLNLPEANNPASDSLVVIGSQYIPLEGRNETGVRPDLQGTWVLNSMPASEGAERTNSILNTPKPATSGTENAKPYTGSVIGESMKNSREVRRDSTTTRTKDSGTITETTVYLINKDPENRITPPQGSNYHIPERPSLNFYGSNETFSGFTGCNKISGRYKMTGTNSISFQNAAPSTKMVCIGDYNETDFLNTLHRVTAFKAANNQLQLMEGDKVLLTFSKK